MFDTTIVKQGPSCIRQTTTEVRAPTDESVALLHEFQEKALKDLVETYCFKNDNDVKGEIIVRKIPFSDCSFNVTLAFSINGKKYMDTMQIGSMEIMECEREEYYRNLLRRKMADKIFELLMGKVKEEK